jgi:hypothetical protein
VQERLMQCDRCWLARGTAFFLSSVSSVSL